LNNCAIASASNAFVLLPQKVSRNRFLADLWLDRCTVVADGNFVRLGPWPGREPGPDRPWLVSSNSSAFLDATPPPRAGGVRRSVLLRADEEAMAHGAVFWQGDRDAYELARFTASDRDQLTAERKRDVQHSWINFWGHYHIVNVTGPKPGDPKASGISLAVRRQPESIGPADLVVSVAQRNRTVGADSVRLGISAAANPSRPGRAN
jgi:serine/threonine-protein kinase